MTKASYPIVFPPDNAAALAAFYGDPAHNEPGERMVSVKPPFKLYYDKALVTKLGFHKLAAPALERTFAKIWAYYHEDQKVLDKLEISNYSGAYAHRLVRGSTSKWSNHAYAAAYDMDAEGNEMGKLKGTIPYPVIAAFKSEGFSWGGDYHDRKDWMHFEACNRGDPVRTFDEWLKFYNCPPMTADPKAKHAAPTTPPITLDKTEYTEVKAAKPLPAPVASPAPTPPPVPASVPPPVVKPATTVTVPSDEVKVQGDPDIWHMQRRLKAMKYNPAELDGVWGGQTAGALAGFINDRPFKMTPPTSLDEFNAVKAQLSDEMSKAESEGFMRPVAPERKAATPEVLANKLPEVGASIKSERVTFWGSIATAVSAAITGVSKMMGDAVGYIQPIKDMVGDVPWQVWVMGALAVAGALYWVSLKSGQAKDAAVSAYKDGSRA